MTNMPAQTQESKRAGMDAFLDIYEEFEDAIKSRYHQKATYTDPTNRLAMFAIYIGRME